MFVLSSAVHVAGIMMVMAFRGWIFWIVNVTLAIYMFTQTFKIYDYNQMRRKVRQRCVMGLRDSRHLSIADIR